MELERPLTMSFAEKVLRRNFTISCVGRHISISKPFYDAVPDELKDDIIELYLTAYGYYMELVRADSSINCIKAKDIALVKAQSHFNGKVGFGVKDNFPPDISHLNKNGLYVRPHDHFNESKAKRLLGTEKGRQLGERAERERRASKSKAVSPPKSEEVTPPTPSASREVQKRNTADEIF